MIKAIVLDIGGVLVRTEDPLGRREIEAEFNLPPHTVEAFVFDSQEAAASTLGEVNANEVWQSIGEKLNLTKGQLDKFIESFWRGDVFDHNLHQFFQSLRENYTTAFLTNAWQGARDDLAKRFGIIEGETVDYLLISSELGVAKPDPKIYKKLRQTVNLPYNEILFVDDFSENISAADQLGIQTIHFQKGLDPISEIQSMLGKAP